MESFEGRNRLQTMAFGIVSLLVPQSEVHLIGTDWGDKNGLGVIFTVLGMLGSGFGGSAFRAQCVGM